MPEPNPRQSSIAHSIMSRMFTPSTSSPMQTLRVNNEAKESIKSPRAITSPNTALVVSNIDNKLMEMLQKENRQLKQLLEAQSGDMQAL